MGDDLLPLRRLQGALRKERVRSSVKPRYTRFFSNLSLSPLSCNVQFIVSFTICQVEYTPDSFSRVNLESSVHKVETQGIYIYRELLL